MSTRSMIQITNHGHISNFYHHHDGYFAGVGAELTQLLGNWKYYGQKQDIIGLFQILPKEYESVEHSPEQQADLEYIYTVDITAKTVILSGFKRGTLENKVENWGTWELYELFMGIIKIANGIIQYKRTVFPLSE